METLLSGTGHSRENTLFMKRGSIVEGEANLANFVFKNGIFVSFGGVIMKGGEKAATAKR